MWGNRPDGSLIVELMRFPSSSDNENDSVVGRPSDDGGTVLFDLLCEPGRLCSV